MASGAKTALMLALMVAMAVAVQAGSHTVSCTNNYCKPVTVNGIVVGVGATVDVLVDDVLLSLTCLVDNLLGNLVSGSCGCPSGVTGVTLSGVLDELLGVGVDLVVTVTSCTVPSLLGTILASLHLNLAICL